MSFEIYSGNINNWNNYIVDLPNHSFYQIFEWGDYSKSQGWEILRLIQFKEKKIISMSQILYKKQFGVYIFWLPGGPSGSLENWFDEVRSLINDRFGSLFYFRVNSSSFYNNSVKNNQMKQKSLDKLQGDQNVVTELTSDIVEDMPNLKVKPKDKVKPYPDDWTFSYKWHDRKDPRFDRGRWDFSRGEGSIAVFHGKPNPHESDQDWVKNNWK